ncbi:hypothetical protein OPKNFCMD_0229 [Methylobacterium crusticola]|uniref:NADP-dependent oxidoreductase domain-containing protein n=2 Tax=Methylobacterium crusticola TaxID=1697972 RepID=A0ABQ4QQH8_9HYPH|nr:hypothetical protein OPKNFCMD_0229 [Methylobacterium crusticola]
MRRIALGTAQLGLDYGISNAGGQVSRREARAILADAAGRGVDLLDTAAAYGEAEAVIGALRPESDAFAVVTKTIRLPGDDAAAVAGRARASLDRLGRPAAEALLVHAAADLAGRAGDALWRALADLKAEGAYRRIGISAYAADDPAGLARRFRPDLMQVPVSLLDQRLVRDGTLAALAASGVEIHARSLFLQGLVFLAPERLPPALAHAGPALAARRDRAGGDMLGAALHFGLALPEVARLVVGVTSLAEWRALAAAAAAPSPGLDWPAFALDDATVLNPAAWRRDGP